MSDASVIAREQLLSIVERAERLEEEIKGINDDKKELYAEAKANGYDTKVIKKVLAIRRQDPSEREEQDAILDMYMVALGMVPAITRDVRVQVQAHEPTPKNSVRDSDAAVQKGTSERSQLAPAGDVSEESPAKNAPVPQTNDEPSSGVAPQSEAPHAGTGSEMSADREGRFSGEGANALPINSDQVRPDLTADEDSLPQGAVSSATNSDPMASESGIGDARPAAPAKAEPSSAQVSNEAEEGAQSQSVRTEPKSGKHRGGDRLPVPSIDPHRMGSFKVGSEMPDMPKWLSEQIDARHKARTTKTEGTIA